MDAISKKSIEMYSKIAEKLSPGKTQSAILTLFGILLGGILSQFYKMANLRIAASSKCRQIKSNQKKIESNQRRIGRQEEKLTEGYESQLNNDQKLIDDLQANYELRKNELAASKAKKKKIDETLDSTAGKELRKLTHLESSIEDYEGFLRGEDVCGDYQRKKYSQSSVIKVMESAQDEYTYEDKIKKNYLRILEADIATARSHRLTQDLEVQKIQEQIVALETQQSTNMEETG